MDLDHPHLPGFLRTQLCDYGGHAELDSGRWTRAAVTRADFLGALHSCRRNLSRGAPFPSFDTEAPCMNQPIARPVRFIQQRFDSHPELAALDPL